FLVVIPVAGVLAASPGFPSFGRARSCAERAGRCHRGVLPDPQPPTGLEIRTPYSISAVFDLHRQAPQETYLGLGSYDRHHLTLCALRIIVTGSDREIQG
ncbi:hypothetical protein, partial [Nonomuraea sp. NPDC049695]|uniref:hypothetical protein n=1 Tax=Nonomuraea sp. NPDC049695 TaxID=3154734 RepID=UPI003443EB9B